MTTSITACRRHRRLFLVFVILGSFLAAGATTASAYDDDTHFWLTYYLARKAGYTHIQSTQIASATVSVDYDKNTRPATAISDRFLEKLSPIEYLQDIHAKYHAMPWKSEVLDKVGGGPMLYWDPTEIPDSWRDTTKGIVNERRDKFWQETWNRCSNPGVFLHYLQDSFAHEGFLGRIGHVGYERVDFIATDVPKAHLMAEATLRYLIAYRQRSTPNTCVQGNAPDVTNVPLEQNILADVYRVIDRFAAANPSSGRPETNLILAWRGLTDDQKLASGLWRKLINVPPPDMDLALAGRLECGARPDSYLARDIIVDEFRLSLNEVPRMWMYDLTSNATAKYAITREYFEYPPQRPVRTIESSNGRTEDANKTAVCPRPAQYEAVDCLAFMLSGDSQISLPTCQVKKDTGAFIGECQYKKD